MVHTSFGISTIKHGISFCTWQKNISKGNLPSSLCHG